MANRLSGGFFSHERNRSRTAQMILANGTDLGYLWHSHFLPKPARAGFFVPGVSMPSNPLTSLVANSLAGAPKPQRNVLAGLLDPSRYKRAMPQYPGPNVRDQRHDGSGPKGLGFLGVLNRPGGGVSTEISIGVNLGGRETEIPLMVPTLSNQELKYLMSVEPNALNGPMYKSIEQKAIEHARQRLAEGLSAFK